MFWRDHDGRVPVIQGGNYDMSMVNDVEVSFNLISFWSQFCKNYPFTGSHTLHNDTACGEDYLPRSRGLFLSC